MLKDSGINLSHYATAPNTLRKGLSTAQNIRPDNPMQHGGVPTTGILDLVRSHEFSLRARGIFQITNLLRNGIIEDGASSHEILQRLRERDTGRMIAQEAIGILYPDVNPAYVSAWIDGGSPEDWLARVQQNRATIAALEDYKPGAAAELTQIFGIRNFYRFPLDHWKRQYDERHNLEKQHIPFYMSVHDDVNEHTRTARTLMRFGNKHQDIALRIYEWETGTDIINHLYASAKTYGPAQKNLYVISHGNIRGITGGQDEAQGRVTIFDLTTTTFADAIKQATGESAHVVLISCETGGRLNGSLSNFVGQESFAERLSGFSSRTVIAPEEEISLERLEYENGNTDQTIVPVYYSLRRRRETYGRTFLADTVQNTWRRTIN